MNSELHISGKNTYDILHERVYFALPHYTQKVHKKTNFYCKIFSGEFNTLFRPWIRTILNTSERSV